MVDISVEELRSKIITYRAKNNLTQKRFAKICKLTTQTICNVENGNQNPSRLTKAKILDAIQRGALK